MLSQISENESQHHVLPTEAFQFRQVIGGFCWRRKRESDSVLGDEQDISPLEDR
jgi:hypothetical protein